MLLGILPELIFWGGGSDSPHKRRGAQQNGANTQKKQKRNHPPRRRADFSRPLEDASGRVFGASVAPISLAPGAVAQLPVMISVASYGARLAQTLSRPGGLGGGGEGGGGERGGGGRGAFFFLRVLNPRIERNKCDTGMKGSSENGTQERKGLAWTLWLGRLRIHAFGT